MNFLTQFFETLNAWWNYQVTNRRQVEIRFRVPFFEIKEETLIPLFEVK